MLDIAEPATSSAETAAAADQSPGRYTLGPPPTPLPSTFAIRRIEAIHEQTLLANSIVATGRLKLPVSMPCLALTPRPRWLLCPSKTGARGHNLPR